MPDFVYSAHRFNWFCAVRPRPKWRKHAANINGIYGQKNQPKLSDPFNRQLNRCQSISCCDSWMLDQMHSGHPIIAASRIHAYAVLCTWTRSADQAIESGRDAHTPAIYNMCPANVNKVIIDDLMLRLNIIHIRIGKWHRNGLLKNGGYFEWLEMLAVGGMHARITRFHVWCSHGKPCGRYSQTMAVSWYVNVLVVQITEIVTIGPALNSSHRL